ncbi:sugar phosphate isomerase/epimerase family protein [Candidatus Poriferisocius sp.]|uniref:sugar phosphate isomerase/epimerase family protein n=1 Tax=Candidatus Poriferisocius sp. TaxID=3101276 RepID=UPI003B02A951
MPSSPYLCTGTLGRVLWESKARAAAKAGFVRLSIYRHEHRQLRERGWDDLALLNLLGDLNLKVAEYDGAVLTMQSPGDAEETVAAAAAIGARSITVLEHSGWQPGEHIDQAAATLAEISDMAAEHDILVLIEPFAWSPLDDHRVAARIVERADRPNAGLLLDTWHLCRGPEQGRLDPTIDPAIIGAIQIAGTGPTPANPQSPRQIAHECMHHRLLPGDGHTNIASLLGNLTTRGVNAPVGIEVFSDKLNTLNPETAAHQAKDSFDRLTL